LAGAGCLQHGDDLEGRCCAHVVGIRFEGEGMLDAID
jgi:hypothetical protein